MSEVHATLVALRQFLDAPKLDAQERVTSFTAHALSAELQALGLDDEDVKEAVGHWDEFRRDASWSSLLASWLVTVERQCGHIDEPIGIWGDLDESGTSGRLFYFYLFALGTGATRRVLRDQGASDEIIEATLQVLARHAGIHRRKWGTAGVDAGWWMVPTLRGEFVQVESLQFHRVHLGVGSLSPSSWYSSDEAAAFGEGFGVGDESLGIHIPQGARLSPGRLDETFDLARRVLGRMWPATQRRLATCESWLLDDQLVGELDPESNIVHFQRRFTLVPRWYVDDDDVLEFVFRRPGTSFADLPRTTTLERAVLEHLERGGHWRIRAGWFDFDGPPTSRSMRPERQ